MNIIEGEKFYPYIMDTRSMFPKFNQGFLFKNRTLSCNSKLSQVIICCCCARKLLKCEQLKIICSSSLSSFWSLSSLSSLKSLNRMYSLSSLGSLRSLSISGGLENFNLKKEEIYVNLIDFLLFYKLIKIRNSNCELRQFLH